MTLAGFELRKLAAADPRLSPPGHCDRQLSQHETHKTVQDVSAHDLQSYNIWHGARNGTKLPTCNVSLFRTKQYQNTAVFL